MDIKLGFLTSLGTNVGDEFIREGIRHVFDATLIPYHPLYVNKVAEATICAPTEDEPGIVGNKFHAADVFVQAGAPVYWAVPPHTSLTSEWHQWFWEKLVLTDAAGKAAPIFLNLGAGSCQPWGEGPEAFLADPACVDFARRAAARSMVTTVRDPLAAQILTALGINHTALPCPAFLAAARHGPRQHLPDLVGVNLMPLSSHFDFRGNFDQSAWCDEVTRLLAGLRQRGRLLFICHDREEEAFAQLFAWPDERIFVGSNWREYLDIYAQCEAVIANRVHGAVCAAGFGVPSLIIGNDSRAAIGDYIGLPRFHSMALDLTYLLRTFDDLRAKRVREKDRLLALRDHTAERYRELVMPALAAVIQRGPRKATPPVALGSVGQLESAVYRSFMKGLNVFAAEHALHQFTNWSKVWEYPWLWFHGLGAHDWKHIKILDIGSEISPLPWYLASLGAKVTLIEADGQWVPAWEKMRAKTGAKVDWHIVTTEKLPVADAAFDIVTSFSVIEHQPDKPRAINEVIRVLKSGGMLALSFDICEPDLGMTFPAWNGSALTLKQFEDIIWRHPGFANDAPLSWNTLDMTAFKEWNLQSAPHHNYVVGAAILRKAT